MIAPQIVLAFTLIVLATVILLTPRMSRRGLYFGWTVPPNFAQTANGRRIFRTYAAILLIAALPALYLAIARTNGAGIPILLTAYVLAYAWARNQVRPHQTHATQLREASLVTRHDSLPGGWLAWLAPFAIPAASMYLAAQHWDQIPARVALHYDAAGEADRWTAKTWGSVNALPLLSLCISSALLLMAWQLTRSRHISASGAAADSEARRRRFTLVFLLGMIYLLNLLFGAISLETLHLINGSPARAMVLILIVSVAAILVFMFRYARERQDLEPPADLTSDDHWHFGLFYANPADPSILVEQRVGFGYSLNFGRPAAWGILALALAPAIGMSFLK